MSFKGRCSHREQREAQW